MELAEIYLEVAIFELEREISTQYKQQLGKILRSAEHDSVNQFIICSLCSRSNLHFH